MSSLDPERNVSRIKCLSSRKGGGPLEKSKPDKNRLTNEEVMEGGTSSQVTRPWTTSGPRPGCGVVLDLPSNSFSASWGGAGYRPSQGSADGTISTALQASKAGSYQVLVLDNLVENSKLLERNTVGGLVRATKLVKIDRNKMVAKLMFSFFLTMLKTL